jgi:lysophospholipase L1-like esterase
MRNTGKPILSLVGLVFTFTTLPAAARQTPATANSSNLQKLRANLNSTPATLVFIGDSITAGTGAASPASGWASQVVDQIQKSENKKGGAGFCSTEGSPSCTSSSSGTWTPVQGMGPSQMKAPVFAETKKGAPGATWASGPYPGTIVDVLYYSDEFTSSAACRVSIDGRPAVKAGGNTPDVAPRSFTVSGLSKLKPHRVVVTSDGTCNLFGVNFRNDTGLTMWNAARGGATTGAFESVNQLSWLTVVPNLAGIVVALGQNDIGTYVKADSLEHVTRIVKANQALAHPAPMFFVFTEAPQGDAGQGALYAAIQQQIVTPNGYDSVSIYDLWGKDSYAKLPKFYVRGSDVIHPSQAGHDAIAAAVLKSWF